VNSPLPLLRPLPLVVVVSDDWAPAPLVVTVVEPEFSPCEAVRPVPLATPPSADSPVPLCLLFPLEEPVEVTVVTTSSSPFTVEADMPRPPLELVVAVFPVPLRLSPDDWLRCEPRE